MSARAVFLDRDGVLNEPVVRDGKPYPPASAADLQIVTGAAEGLARLKALGYLLIVVTNQPDVARGDTTRESVEEINERLLNTLPLDEVQVCYHDDADRCRCRKPLPGLLIEAAGRNEIDLAASFMIGDRWRDIDAGAAAGCRTILIERGWKERAPKNSPGTTVESLEQAVLYIERQTRCISPDLPP